MWVERRKEGLQTMPNKLCMNNVHCSRKTKFRLALGHLISSQHHHYCPNLLLENRAAGNFNLCLSVFAYMTIPDRKGIEDAVEPKKLFL